MFSIGFQSYGKNPLVFFLFIAHYHRVISLKSLHLATFHIRYRLSGSKIQQKWHGHVSSTFSKYQSVFFQLKHSNEMSSVTTGPKFRL